VQSEKGDGPANLEISPKQAVDFSAIEGNKVVSRAKFPAPPPETRLQKMVKIRLRREGTKDRPYYKVVATDSRARREGPYIEQIGTYDPMKDDNNVDLDLEKVDKWLGNGAQPSDTVRSLIKKVRAASAES